MVPVPEFSGIFKIRRFEEGLFVTGNKGLELIFVQAKSAKFSVAGAFSGFHTDIHTTSPPSLDWIYGALHRAVKPG